MQSSTADNNCEGWKRGTLFENQVKLKRQVSWKAAATIVSNLKSFSAIANKMEKHV